MHTATQRVRVPMREEEELFTITIYEQSRLYTRLTCPLHYFLRVTAITGLNSLVLSREWWTLMRMNILACATSPIASPRFGL